MVVNLVLFLDLVSDSRCVSSFFRLKTSSLVSRMKRKAFPSELSRASWPRSTALLQVREAAERWEWKWQLLHGTNIMYQWRTGSLTTPWSTLKSVVPCVPSNVAFFSSGFQGSLWKAEWHFTWHFGTRFLWWFQERVRKTKPNAEMNKTILSGTCLSSKHLKLWWFVFSLKLVSFLICAQDSSPLFILEVCVGFD